MTNDGSHDLLGALVLIALAVIVPVVTIAGAVVLDKIRSRRDR